MDRLAARDFLYGFCRDQYRAAVTAITGTVPQVVYKDVPSDQPPNDTHWARIVAHNTYQGQETLRNGNSVRRFVTEGIVYVQMFAPAASEHGTTHIDLIGEGMLTAFRQYQGADIEFTNAQIADNIAAEPGWLRINVWSVFQYRQFM